MTTTPYHILFAPAAERAILALPSKQQKMILQFIAAHAINPRPPSAMKIEGMTELYNHAIEGLRIIYKIDHPEVLILLVK